MALFIRERSFIVQPLLFEPLIKCIRWGGTRLGSVLGKEIGAAQDAAESWELVDHGEDQSVVTAGDPDYIGWTLHRLVTERREELFGCDERWRDVSQYPLLIKFLDACDTLSVQVHPNDAQAKQYDPAEDGKTECWVILQADPGSVIYAGLEAGVDRDAFLAALEADEVEHCLHQLSVQPGDCVFIPAGTVHAIGAGVVLAEIQQSSDLTFRLHDWGRLGSDGKPRRLHIEQALACIDFACGPVGPQTAIPLADSPDRLSEELVRCDYFTLLRHTIAGNQEFPAEDCCRALLVIDGSVELQSGDCSLKLSKGQTCLVPAGNRLNLICAEKTVILDARPR